MCVFYRLSMCVSFLYMCVSQVACIKDKVLTVDGLQFKFIIGFLLMFYSDRKIYFRQRNFMVCFFPSVKR